MIEQIQQNSKTIIDKSKMKFQSQIFFLNKVSCSSCGTQMQFVEHDVIFGENWYHVQCWENIGGKQNV